MARKKPTPAITYTELLNLAYRALEREVQDWRYTVTKSTPNTPDNEATVKAICAEQLRKMETIKTLYTIETGYTFD